MYLHCAIGRDHYQNLSTTSEKNDMKTCHSCVCNVWPYTTRWITASLPCQKHSRHDYQSLQLCQLYSAWALISQHAVISVLGSKTTTNYHCVQPNSWGAKWVLASTRQVHAWFFPPQLPVLHSFRSSTQSPLSFVASYFVNILALDASWQTAKAFLCSQGLQQDSLYSFATCYFFFIFVFNGICTLCLR